MDWDDVVGPDKPGFDSEAYRQRIAAAIAEHVARPRTIKDAVAEERRRRKEARLAKGLSAKPVDLLRLSIKLLEREGYLVERCEWYDAVNKRRHDLFGCVDAVAVGPLGTIAVQSTSWDNVSARVAKMRSSQRLALALQFGWKAVVHGWRKGANGRFEHKEVWLDADQ
ncbi:MAG: hypothetical protein KF884_10770 [Fimbriimonadaceae bacterium]|nr:hypothetical protein [Fimbriimonadaceae bacterium]QYK58029.1 MAG: hypothetical protein KF884_10770 [Fimbriimonadaceae bacterium]